MYTNNTFNKWVLAFILLLGFGCQNSSINDVQTAAYPPTATQHEIAPTVTHVGPENLSLLKLLDFTDLRQSQYLLVQSYEKGTPNLYVYSTEGQIEKRFSLDAKFSVSNDGTQLLIMQPSLRLYHNFNLHTQELTPLNIEGDCYDASLSPDQQFIALSCSNDWTSDIYVFEKNSGTILRITDCLEKAHSCFKPSWSLDGEWIAYYRNEEKSGIHTLDGVYLLNTTCKETTCEKQVGPITSDSSPTWSQDSELVTSEFGSINFFKVTENSIIFDRKHDSSVENVVSIHLSPDGEYIAFAPFDNSAVYLYSTKSEAVEKLIELDQEVLLIGWIINK